MELTPREKDKLLIFTAALVAERAFEYLDAPVVRVAPPDTPVPYAPTLEEYFLPNAETVGAAIRALHEY